MDLTFKNRAGTPGGRVLLFALSLIACAITSLFSQLGIILIPLASVFLTLLFLSERGARPTFSVIASVIAVSVDFAFNALYSLCVLVSVAVAFLVYLALTRNAFTKGECAILVTILIAVLFGYMMLTSAFFELGSVDLNAALDYYASMVDELRAEWQSISENLIAKSASAGQDISVNAELLLAMFDSMVASTVSLVAIFAFLLAGIMFKLLGAALGVVLVDRRVIDGWQFILTPAYAYAFVGAYVISIFLTEADVFGITVLNFVNVFIAIFAYLGFTFVLSILERHFTSKLAAFAIAIVALLIFASSAMQLLAFVGAIAVVLYDKAKNLGGNFDKE